MFTLGSPAEMALTFAKPVTETKVSLIGRRLLVSLAVNFPVLLSTSRLESVRLNPYTIEASWNEVPALICCLFSDVLDLAGMDGSVLKYCLVIHKICPFTDEKI